MRDTKLQKSNLKKSIFTGVGAGWLGVLEIDEAWGVARECRLFSRQPQVRLSAEGLDMCSPNKMQGQWRFVITLLDLVAVR